MHDISLFYNKILVLSFTQLAVLSRLVDRPVSESGPSADSICLGIARQTSALHLQASQQKSSETTEKQILNVVMLRCKCILLWFGKKKTADKRIILIDCCEGGTLTCGHIYDLTRLHEYV